MASAQTFYVNQRNGTPSSKCGIYPGGRIGEHEEEDPCLTINAAIKKSEGAKGPNTVEVSPEENELHPFKEEIHLTSSADSGLTINGEEPGVRIIDSGSYAMEVEPNAGSVTLSNVEVKAESVFSAIRSTNANVRLLNDTIVAESVNSGIQAIGGSLTLEGDHVTLESASGVAVIAEDAPLIVSATKIFNGEGGIGSESSGIDSEGATLMVDNSTIVNEGSSKPSQHGIYVEGDSQATIQNTTVKQGGAGIGVFFEATPVTVEGLDVEMLDPTSKLEGVHDEGQRSSFSHLEVTGTWSGPAMEIYGGEVTLTDSHLATSPSSKALALGYRSTGEPARGLLIQRSVIQSARKAIPAALSAIGGNVTIDSSEVLGGTAGVAFESNSGTRTITIAGSTVGGVPGISLEAPGVVGVDAKATGKSASTASVVIEGSVFTESQVATAALNDKAIVSCTYSAIPSQVQTPNQLTETGEIGCASGTAGNTNSSGEFESLFAESLVNYKLKPSSTAIDSVPVSAITLPFGLTPSTTDLEGNPRYESVACKLLQDKGALELPGLGTACPSTPVVTQTPTTKPTPAAKPLAGILTSLTLSPSAFFPAPSGATVSAVTASKKKYGTKISYRDSQVATTTFTVLRESTGRKHGKSCQKPSPKNKHGKRCTLLTKVGTFTHTDKAGANSLHFSGRIKGKKLPAGTYELQAVAHDAAGNGPTVSKNFKVDV
ncbi:MAG: hypothetical protein ABR992_12240 [Solirubrobacteraceae bacterium]